MQDLIAQYPSLLRPTTTETLGLGGLQVLVPKVELHLRPWQGAPIADMFGGKPLIDFAGQPVFAELAVYELLRLSGWQARWIETYGAPAASPKCYTAWLPTSSWSQQVHQPIEDASVQSRLQAIAVANGHTFAGCWDVVGWHGTKLLFAECKRRRQDRLRSTQPRWLAASLQAGLQPENFLLVEWDFLPGA